MKIKEKSWLWLLTWPFAWGNYTTVGDTIYYPHGGFGVTRDVQEHEEIHARQQQEMGLTKFLFLYLFVLPVLWNPWRYKWEMEAFIKGSKFSHEEADKLLSSGAYGWLINSDVK